MWSLNNSKKIFNASEKAGFIYVGGLRTNRVIYPTNHERLDIRLNNYGKTLTKDDVDLKKRFSNKVA